MMVDQSLLLIFFNLIETLVNNIQLLTQDVAKLQNNQMKLYRENTVRLFK